MPTGHPLNLTKEERAERRRRYLRERYRDPIIRSRVNASNVASARRRRERRRDENSLRLSIPLDIQVKP